MHLDIKKYVCYKTENLWVLWFPKNFSYNYVIFLILNNWIAAISFLLNENQDNKNYYNQLMKAKYYIHFLILLHYTLHNWIFMYFFNKLLKKISLFKINYSKVGTPFFDSFFFFKWSGIAYFLYVKRI